MKVWYSIFLILLTSLQPLHAFYFDFDQQCSSAYEEIMRMKVPLARKMLATEKLLRPENLITDLLEDYCDLFTAFISESEEDLKIFENGFNRRIKRIEQAPDNHPFKKFCLAELYLHSAATRFKFQQLTTGFLHLNKAYKLLEENEKSYPDFYPNKKSLGLLRALFAAVPSKYQWGLRLFGIKPSISMGKKMLDEFIKSSEAGEKWFYEEGLIWQIYLQVMLENDINRAYETTMQRFNDEQNLLHYFIRGEIAFRKGNTDQAIFILQNKPQSAEYLSFLYLDYLLGSYKMYRGDKDAQVFLKKYTDEFKGRHYIKDCYQKLAFLSLLSGDQQTSEKYHAYTRTLGAAFTDSDKKALREAGIHKHYHLGLLRARLFFDGSYFEDALNELEKIIPSSLRESEDLIEYSYRKARVREALGYYYEALRLYDETIRLATGTSYYYGPKSCVLMAQIFEKNNQDKIALSWYDKCLTYDGYDYQTGIEQQAKAGINRIKTK